MKKTVLFSLLLLTINFYGMEPDQLKKLEDEQKISHIIDITLKDLNADPQDTDHLYQLLTRLTNRAQKFPKNKISKDLLEALTNCQQACLFPLPKEKAGLRRSLSFYEKSQTYQKAIKTWTDNRSTILLHLVALEMYNNFRENNL